MEIDFHHLVYLMKELPINIICKSCGFSVSQTTIFLMASGYNLAGQTTIYYIFFSQSGLAHEASGSNIYRQVRLSTAMYEKCYFKVPHCIEPSD